MRSNRCECTLQFQVQGLGFSLPLPPSLLLVALCLRNAFRLLNTLPPKGPKYFHQRFGMLKALPPPSFQKTFVQETLVQYHSGASFEFRVQGLGFRIKVWRYCARVIL